MQNFLKYVIIIGLFVGAISCDLLIVEDENSGYPTLYSRYSKSELQEINQEYHVLNNGLLCSTLNEYGFTGYSEVLFEDDGNPCDRNNREVVRVEMNNTDTLLTAAKKSLLRNSVYTGVEDTSALILEEMHPIPGCTENCGGPNQNLVNIEWMLVFEEQKVDSVKVPGTEISVVIDAKGVNRIWGNWYADFKIPPFVNYGYLEVMEGIVGWEIDMRNYNDEAFIYTVQEEDVTERPVLMHKTSETGNGLEMRTCWAVPVKYQGKDFEGWMAYIDIKEGHLVELAAMQEK